MKKREKKSIVQCLVAAGILLCGLAHLSMPNAAQAATPSAYLYGATFGGESFGSVAMNNDGAIITTRVWAYYNNPEELTAKIYTDSSCRFRYPDQELVLNGCEKIYPQYSSSKYYKCTYRRKRIRFSSSAVAGSTVSVPLYVKLSSSFAPDSNCRGEVRNYTIQAPYDGYAVSTGYLDVTAKLLKQNGTNKRSIFFNISGTEDLTKIVQRGDYSLRVFMNDPYCYGSPVIRLKNFSIDQENSMDPTEKVISGMQTSVGIPDNQSFPYGIEGAVQFESPVLDRSRCMTFRIRNAS